MISDCQISKNRLSCFIKYFDVTKQLFCISAVKYNQLQAVFLGKVQPKPRSPPPPPQPKNTQYHLRHRTHGLILPTDVNAASKKNFLYRMLFSYIY